MGDNESFNNKLLSLTEDGVGREPSPVILKKYATSGQNSISPQSDRRGQVIGGVESSQTIAFA